MRRVMALIVAGFSLACGTTTSPTPPAPVTLSTQQAVVLQRICAECHLRPGIGSPTIGYEDDWKARRAKGFDVLLANTVNGYRQMPPLGTCSFCSEEDLRQLVAYVAGLAPETVGPGSD